MYRIVEYNKKGRANSRKKGQMVWQVVEELDMLVEDECIDIVRVYVESARRVRRSSPAQCQRNVICASRFRSSLLHGRSERDGERN